MTAVAAQPHLTTLTGETMPLERLSIRGRLEDSLAVIEYTQTYRNVESANIEAVYTFPLPFDGTLLQLSAQLNGKALEGVVMEAQQAEDNYEEAITDGDSAIMLEQQGPGLYTMSVGNLMAGEAATISLRYAMPLAWTGAQLRLALPLTLAPRYGNPYQTILTLRPAQIPMSDLVVEYPVELSLDILGELAKAGIDSPTHAIATAAGERGLTISLRDRYDVADRDFVLTLSAENTSAHTSAVAPTEDKNRAFGHAVFRLPPSEAVGPVTMKILVDCSGSMGGSSMALARNAALQALEALQEGDTLTLTAFGSQWEHYDNGQAQQIDATGVSQRVQRWARQLDATFGGTEMAGALRAVFALAADEPNADVLMITDGEIWALDDTVAAARAAGQRLFTVGVGASPAESNLQVLAEATGGFAEFVTPEEDVSPVMARQLRRMRQAPIRDVSLSQPGEIVWQTPPDLNRGLYPGDTVHIWTELNGLREPAGASLRYTDGKGENVALEAPPAAMVLNDAGRRDLIRLAVAARLKARGMGDLGDAKAEVIELAVAHQLVTPLTNYLMVASRGEEQAQQLPLLRPVKHMLARGWGGTASASPFVVHKNMLVHEYPVFSRRQLESNNKEALSHYISRAVDTSDNFVERVETVWRSGDSGLPLTLAGLERMGVPEELLDSLQALVEGAWDEHDVVLAFWAAVMRTELKRSFSRKIRWWCKRALKKAAIEPGLVQGLYQAMAGSSTEELNWAPEGEMPCNPQKNEAG